VPGSETSGGRRGRTPGWLWHWDSSPVKALLVGPVDVTPEAGIESGTAAFNYFRVNEMAYNGPPPDLPSLIVQNQAAVMRLTNISFQEALAHRAVSAPKNSRSVHERLDEESKKIQALWDEWFLNGGRSHV
jgi:hypothetical protein